MSEHYYAACARCTRHARLWHTGRRWLCRTCWRSLLREEPPQ